MAPAGRRLGPVAIAAALAIGGVALTSAGASARPAVAPSVVSHATTKAHALTTPGMKRIESIALTPGTWSIFAKATAYDPGSGDLFRCELEAATTPLDGSTTALASPVTRDTITNVALLKTKQDVTVTQLCGHDGDAGDAGSVDVGASVVAFATSASRVRLVRTTSQTPLPQGSSIGVENISLPKGNWVVAIKASPVDFTGSLESEQCAFAGENPEVLRALGDPSEGTHSVTTVMRVVPVAVAATTTLSLSCEASGTGTYLDPNTVVWAWKATSLVSTAGNECPVTLGAAKATDALVINEAECDIAPGSFPSQIVGAHLRAGTWVVIASVDELIPRSDNVAHCQILSANRGVPLDVSSASLAGALQGPVTGVTNLTVATFAKHGDLEGRCGEDDAGSPADAFTSGWAFVKP